MLAAPLHCASDFRTGIGSGHRQDHLQSSRHSFSSGTTVPAHSPGRDTQDFMRQLLLLPHTFPELCWERERRCHGRTMQKSLYRRLFPALTIPFKASHNSCCSGSAPEVKLKPKDADVAHHRNTARHTGPWSLFQCKVNLGIPSLV